MSCLAISANKTSAAELNPTQYVLKGTQAPFSGFLVEQNRFEKTIIAIADLESTKENSLLKTRLLEIAEKDRDLAIQKAEAQKKEFEFTEKGLKDKIADLDVWYKKPWFVASGVAVLFIATGILLP